jgi:hypothetical protein
MGEKERERETGGEERREGGGGRGEKRGEEGIYTEGVGREIERVGIWRER